MTELRDSIYYAQLARQARKLASTHRDPVVARYLRETAIKHDRVAHKLARLEARSRKPKGKIRSLFPFL